MFQRIGMGHTATAHQANQIINAINLLNVNNNDFDGLLQDCIHRVNQGNRGQLVWNSLVNIYEQLLIEQDNMDVDAMGGARKRCRRSLVNGRMLLRDKKGRFCKKKSMKRKGRK